MTSCLAVTTRACCGRSLKSPFSTGGRSRAPLVGPGREAHEATLMPEPAILARPPGPFGAVAETGARALPANVEAEAAFLGAVLIDNRIVEELPTNLSPTHLFEPVHARIFERIVQLLEDYFHCVVPAIGDAGGEVIKFMGDGVLAFFHRDDASAANAWSIASTGVAPMPALSNTTEASPGRSVKLPRAALVSTRSPACSFSSM